jgi:hypothetical protein
MADFPAVTPADSPSEPSSYAAVPVQGMDIQAPMEDLSATFDAANSVAGAGVLYAQGPRQAQAQALLESPQGAGAVNVTSGFPNDEDTNIMPPPMAGPDRGAGPYPGTGTH